MDRAVRAEITQTQTASNDDGLHTVLTVDGRFVNTTSETIWVRECQASATDEHGYQIHQITFVEGPGFFLDPDEARDFGSYGRIRFVGSVDGLKDVKCETYRWDGPQQIDPDN